MVDENCTAYRITAHTPLDLYATHWVSLQRLVERVKLPHPLPPPDSSISELACAEHGTQPLGNGMPPEPQPKGPYELVARLSVNSVREVLAHPGVEKVVLLLKSCEAGSAMPKAGDAPLQNYRWRDMYDMWEMQEKGVLDDVQAWQEREDDLERFGLRWHGKGVDDVIDVVDEEDEDEESDDDEEEDEYYRDCVDEEEAYYAEWSRISNSYLSRRERRARQTEAKTKKRKEEDGDHDPDLDKLVLWREMKKQVKILRGEMEGERK